MLSKLHNLLSGFSRGSKKAKLNQFMFKNIRSINVNDNGTSGYLIKNGKNSGKVLKHPEIMVLIWFH